MVTTGDRRETDGIEIKSVYTDEDVADLELELPGRGETRVLANRPRPPSVMSLCGPRVNGNSPEETNARFRYLLERGQTGLSVAFDQPT